MQTATDRTVDLQPEVYEQIEQVAQFLEMLLVVIPTGAISRVIVRETIFWLKQLAKGRVISISESELRGPQLPKF